MGRLQKLVEKFTSVRGHVEKHGLFYIFGRNRFPIAVLGHDKGRDKYYILQFKKNNRITTVSNIISPVHDISKVREAVLELEDYAKKWDVFKSLDSDLDKSKFLAQLVKLGLNQVYINQLFPETVGAELENKYKVDNFEVIYQNEKDAKQVEPLLKEACKILSKAGFGKLCYGTVYLVPNLRGNVLADYTEATDTIRVSNKSRKSDTAVKTLIHELGHRLSRKFFKTSDWDKVRDKYTTILSGKLDLKIGDKFIDDKGMEHEIIDTKFTRELNYVFRPTVEGTGVPKFRATRGYFLGKKRSDGSKITAENPFYVSDYAKTNESEFFSEVFSFGLIDKHPELIKFISQFK